MNIFWLANDPIEAAQLACDKHVVKMVLETAQILSTVISQKIGTNWGYGSTHIHHPCIKWAASTRGNFIWLRKYGLALSREYTHRYKRQHASMQYIDGATLPNEYIVIDGDLVDPGDYNISTPAQCMPSYCKDPNPVVAYRNYYIAEKYRMLTYTNREVPSWLTELGLGKYKEGKE